MADVSFPDASSARVSSADAGSSGNKRKRTAYDSASTPTRRNLRTADQATRDFTAGLLAVGANTDDHHFDLASVLQAGNPDSGSPTGAHDASATNGTDSKADNGSSSMDAAAAALAHNYSLNVPTHPADDFNNLPASGDASFEPTAASAGANADGDDGQTGANDPNDAGSPVSLRKPAVGSEEWHKVRKDNHKEVERRRRETINEGINELAAIVPGRERNKGSILARAVQYIQKLQEDASSNIDKWTFEKLVTEQAIAEITAKCNRAFQERNAWKRVAAEAGVDVDAVDLGLPPADADAADDEAAAAARKDEVEANAAEEVQRLRNQREERHAASLAGNAQSDAEAEGDA